MGRMTIVCVSALVVGTGLFVTGNRFVNAQQPSIKRTDLLKTDLAGMEGKEMNIWTADIAPGAATGKHHHPTPRFVIVLEGSVVLEIEGRPPGVLSRAGWSRTVLKVGDTVTVHCSPAKDGSHAGLVARVTLSDGTVLLNAAPPVQ